jgi:glycerol-3-phosphate cytidylyltransferase
MTKKRVLVDMSATLLHHGHIKLLETASSFGLVTVALCSDDEIMKHKGYVPELDFNQRKYILSSIKFVDNVIESPWIIDDDFMERHNMEILIHGQDNSNYVSTDKLVLLPRTVGISSSALREKSCKIFHDLAENLKRNDGAS